MLLPLAVIISGRGSNMVAIARACAAGQINARVARVIADQPGAGGIALARELGLDVSVVPARDYANRSAFEDALHTAIDSSGAKLVVLAGFMRILSPQFTQAYAGALLNIHPSLLPRHPGLHTHERALQAGDREHGATVHYVTSELDAGPRVLQARVPVLPGDTPESLSARVQGQEHIIYPRAIGWIAAGRLRLEGHTVRFDGKTLAEPMILESGAQSGPRING
jgi:phosphoribosylglycinamide formyltransferase-1